MTYARRAPEGVVVASVSALAMALSVIHRVSPSPGEQKAEDTRIYST
jgi:hypothetical protein